MRSGEWTTECTYSWGPPRCALRGTDADPHLTVQGAPKREGQARQYHMAGGKLVRPPSTSTQSEAAAPDAGDILQESFTETDEYMDTTTAPAKAAPTGEGPAAPPTTIPDDSRTDVEEMGVA